MPQTPLGDMADTGYDSMSEEAGYNLHLLKEITGPLSQRVFALEDRIEGHQLYRLTQRIDELERRALSLEQFSAAHRDVLNQLRNLTELVQCLYGHAVQNLDKLKFCSKPMTLTSAQLLSLNTTPVELVQPHGEGTSIEIISLEMFMEYNSVAYTVGAGQDLSIDFATSGQIATVETTGFLDQTSDQRRWSKSIANDKLGENEAVNISTLSSDLTGGDSDLKIKVCYRVIELIK